MFRNGRPVAPERPRTPVAPNPKEVPDRVSASTHMFRNGRPVALAMTRPAITPPRTRAASTERVVCPAVTRTAGAVPADPLDLVARSARAVVELDAVAPHRQPADPVAGTLGQHAAVAHQAGASAGGDLAVVGHRLAAAGAHRAADRATRSQDRTDAGRGHARADIHGVPGP